MRIVPLRALAPPPHAQGGQRGPRSGFTLLEMAVVITIVAIIIASAMTMGNRWITAERYRVTNRNFDAIERAMLTHLRTYRRLPCPSDISLTPGNGQFGVEAANPGPCTGGVPAANFSSGNTVMGGLPTQALDLPASMMTDGWGRKIMYAIDMRMTRLDSADNYPYNESVAIGSIRVDARLANGTTVERNSASNRAVYLLLSYGPNGHGSFLPKSNARLWAGSTDADEWNNCNCNRTAATAADAIFVQSSPFPTFDDIVRYKRRSQLFDLD